MEKNEEVYPGKIWIKPEAYRSRFIKVTRKEDNKSMLLAIEAIDCIEPMTLSSLKQGKMVTDEWSRITIRRNKMYEVVEHIEYFIMSGL